MDQTVEELVKRINNGDQNAVTDLYNKTSSRAFYLALQLVKDEDMAQDILQDSYVKAFMNLNTLSDPAKFQNWLNSIVVNTSKNYLKKKSPILFSQLASSDDNADEQEIDFEDESEQFSPEANVDYSETKHLIKEMIDRLPEKQRIPVILHYMEDYPIAQIAQIMDCSEGTIKSRLSTARGQIKQDVLDLEKQGVKLYCTPLVPFLFWMFHTEASAAAISAAEAGTLAAGTVIGAKAATGAAVNASTAAGTTLGATTAPGTMAGSTVGMGSTVGAAVSTGSTVGASVVTTAAATTGTSAAAAATATGLSLAAKLGIAAAVAVLCIGGTAVGVTVGFRSGNSSSLETAVTQEYGEYNKEPVIEQDHGSVSETEAVYEVTDLTAAQKAILAEGVPRLISCFYETPDQTGQILEAIPEYIDPITVLDELLCYADPQSTRFFTYAEGDWVRIPSSGQWIPDSYRSPWYDKDSALQHMIDFYGLPLDISQYEENLLENGYNSATNWGISIDGDLIAASAWETYTSLGREYIICSTDDYEIVGDKLIVSTPYGAEIITEDGAEPIMYGDVVITFERNPESFFGYTFVSAVFTPDT